MNFRLVAAQEINDRRGDTGDMKMQLVLAATGRRIDCHSNLVVRQPAACPFLDEESPTSASIDAAQIILATSPFPRA
jgi:hypothetical protein